MWQAKHILYRSTVTLRLTDAKQCCAVKKIMSKIALKKICDSARLEKVYSDPLL